MTLESHGNVDDAAPVKGGQPVIALPLVFHSEAAPALAIRYPTGGASRGHEGTTPYQSGLRNTNGP